MKYSSLYFANVLIFNFIEFRYIFRSEGVVAVASYTLRSNNLYICVIDWNYSYSDCPNSTNRPEMVQSNNPRPTKTYNTNDAVHINIILSSDLVYVYIQL